MTGPVSIFAITEMNMRAEDALRKVRMELFRIGCAPERIQVLKQGCYLQLRFQQQIIIADPEEILTVLGEVSAGQNESEVWTKVVNEVHQSRNKSVRRITWGIASVLITILLILLWILVRG